ncbi:hypothetical protein CPC16_003449 [Podila verticillata]|nr:hypothetical protein BGZ52_004871 [Haplosporangium bisporale]KAF9218003.1 hypothetical protein BGZ59_003785 [Podila verticillata]KAF9392295.1 hypothetical protein CPC16_003449 [Podila verticillata]KAI9238619.1 MAG: hypothetical protein BYD32DRAFT_460506 [Podila humilis]
MEIWGPLEDTLAHQMMNNIKTLATDNHFECYLPDTIEGCSDDTLFGTDPSSSYASHDDDENEFDVPTVYSTLWEVQLELGEIPDMISNNLLESCQDCCQQWPCEACSTRASFQRAFSSGHTRWLNIDEPILGVEGEEEEDFESDDESEYRPSLSTIFAGLSTSSIGSCDAHQEGRAQYAHLGPYPVYGSFDDDLIHCEVRHDRKDSGVFIHDHDECGHDEDHMDAKAAVC